MDTLLNLLQDRHLHHQVRLLLLGHLLRLKTVRKEARFNLPLRLALHPAGGAMGVAPSVTDQDAYAENWRV